LLVRSPTQNQKCGRYSSIQQLRLNANPGTFPEGVTLERSLTQKTFSFVFRNSSGCRIGIFKPIRNAGHQNQTAYRYAPIYLAYTYSTDHHPAWRGSLNSHPSRTSHVPELMLTGAIVAVGLSVRRRGVRVFHSRPFLPTAPQVAFQAFAKVHHAHDGSADGRKEEENG
jgi:hypothetical protein